MTGTLTEFFGALESRGSKPALIQVQADGAEVLHYETLASNVSRYAHAMQTVGVRKNDYVIVFAAGGPDWITAFLASIAAGGIPIPLDIQTDEETLEHILGDSAARWAVTDAERAEALAEAGFEGRCLRLDDADDGNGGGNGDGDGWQAVAAETSKAPSPAFDPDDQAVLFYTSGTTGPPKGVPLLQRNVAFQLQAVVEAGLVSGDDRILQPLPPHHVYPLIVGTLAPLGLGLTIVFPEAMLGPQLVAALRAERVSFIVGVPRLYEALVAAIESRIEGQQGLAGAYLRAAYRCSRWIRRKTGWRFGKWLLLPLHRRLAPKLNVLASGGAALDPVLALKIESLGWQVASGYGLTETSPLLTINPPGNGRLASVGRVVPGIELRIDPAADDDGTGQGEILARGGGVFDGYLHHEKSPETFTPDGWFRTADLGHLDADGYVYITGRRNTLLVTSAGKNIQPDELEQHYAEHELIEEIGVLMDDRQLVAVVAPAMAKLPKFNVSAENGVRMALSQQNRELASYKRVLNHVLTRDPLPRTRLGKIQRHKLADLYASLKDNPAHQAPRAAPIPVDEMSKEDRKRLESERVAQVWELLGDNYREHGLTPDSSLQMDLGVDSLGWVELGTEIAQRVGVALDEAQIAAIDTVRDLLDAIATSAAGTALQETPIAAPDAYLSDDQRRWLEPLSPVARGLANALYGVHGTAVRALFSLRVEGLEHLPRDRQRIIAPNHVSFLDPSVIASALPKAALKDTYWAGWTGVAFRNCLFRGISRLAQVVPIDTQRAATSSLAFAAAVLDRGKNLVLFPEGERSSTGELLQLKPGIGLLAEHFENVAIVPAWIDGALEAWPRDKALPRLHKISVKFGEALKPEQLKAADRDGNLAEAVTAELRQRLEALRG